ncbi:M50 family metallopeptidase [Corynebacterium suicordis]|uniref:Zinc metalloprotease Rip1 n=1 Tax=Corynebacterium suicordis DSM 45110 TaxID=1121369 RepID=A0ABR9ZJ07_9CORY|nr:site-2 protease family protein [Corynebacterium suicordis]MBF4553415.1 site-2 protease family protein [Corynebacterium suicordis DSM 45110]MDR6277610.1 membrane-associated protease RseP (regulator of RpoE activity) [Corynebacterium suicordis]
MAFIIGVLLFALGIVVSIALHEAGHMYTARMFGMRVRRYFIGFGPTIWSRKKGNTEYGFKAVPLGGFCDIAGMTKLHEMTEEERPYAMYDRPAYQRIIVMLGGIIVNIALALGIIYGIALAWGLPETNKPFTPLVEQTQCVAPQQNADGTLAKCEGAGPAASSGVRPGDKFVSVDGEETPTFPDFQKAITKLGDESDGQPGDTLTVPAVVQREGREVPLDLQVALVERIATSGKPMTVGAVGIQAVQPKVEMVRYNPATAVVGSAAFAGNMVEQTIQGVVQLPQRFPAVVESIFGGNRDTDSPMSVVGASRLGGEMVELDMWQAFFMTLASLNLFLAAFNLVPLPPLDGGHIIVIVYEKIRDFFRRLRGLQPGGPADYTKLMPLTYAATLILMVFGFTVIVADIVNPVQVF